AVTRTGTVTVTATGGSVVHTAAIAVTVSSQSSITVSPARSALSVCAQVAGMAGWTTLAGSARIGVGRSAHGQTGGVDAAYSAFTGAFRLPTKPVRPSWTASRS